MPRQSNKKKIVSREFFSNESNKYFGKKNVHKQKKTGVPETRLEHVIRSNEA